MSYTPPRLPAPATIGVRGQYHFHAITLVGAVVAAVTTFATIAAMLPAWAMFLGWVAYSTIGETTRERVANVISFLLGLGVGVGNGLLIACLTPLLGGAATPIVVFGDVVLVLSLRTLRPINNPLAWFLGLISFFASAQTPSLSLLAELAFAGLIGALAAGLANVLQSRMYSAA
jgi:hypothetical protein